MKKIFILAAFCWIGIVSIEAVHARDAELETVTIQLKWYHQYQFAGYYVAVKKCFYAEEGLKVELRQFDSPEYVNNVLQGRAQYGVSDPGIILRRLNGQPVVLVAQIFQHTPLVFLTLESSGIRFAKDLAGKRVMLDTKGYANLPIVAMLKKELGGQDAGDPNSLSDSYIRSILEDTSGNLWIGAEAGLNRVVFLKDSGIKSSLSL